MTEQPNVFACLARVMADVTAVGKAGRNADQGYAYRGLDQVLVAVAPSLRAHGVVVVPTVEAAEYAQVEIGRHNTRMVCCRVRVRYRWHGPAGDYLDATVVAEAMDSADKATSKAMSVAFRTCLLQALSLPVEDNQAITPGQLRKIMLLSKQAGLVERADRLAYAAAAIGREIESANDLSVTEAGAVIEALEIAAQADGAQPNAE